jgi:SAM-dependent methyltransferase
LRYYTVPSVFARLLDLMPVTSPFRSGSVAFAVLCAAAFAVFALIGGGCERPGTPVESGLRPGAAESLAVDTADVYGRTAPSSDGTGKTYLGREIARVMGHRAAGWLERPERATSELPARVVSAMNLRPSDAVADLGAGTGYFTFRIAPQVPRGTVYAVDIQPEMLEEIRRIMKARSIGNVVPVRGTARDPKLPAGRVDAALMVDAYHEFAYPREMMLGVRRALRPGGRVYLVEYRREDSTVPIKPLHKMTQRQAVREMRTVGLRHLRTEDVLPRQHLMIFEKPAE